MGLMDSPLCRKCGAGEETSAHVLCECEVLATLRHIYLGSFFLDPENVRSLSLRAVCNCFRRTGLLWLGPSEGAQKTCQGLRAVGPWGLDPHLPITQPLCQINAADLHVMSVMSVFMEVELNMWQQTVMWHGCWHIVQVENMSPLKYIDF
jgi:hypothetical protein